MLDGHIADQENDALRKPDWLYSIHKWSGLVSIPFLLISIAIAIGLTHPKLLEAASEYLYDSLPIPSVELGEPVKQGSWEQALKLANQAVGLEGHVITQRAENSVVVQGFEQHTHDSGAHVNPRVRVEIDTNLMRIVRITDRTASLVSQAHSIHAIEFFGIPGFSVATVTSVALLVLLISGGLLAWRDRKAGRHYGALSHLHVRAGQLAGLLILVIVVTTIHLEFGVFGKDDRTVTHPIPKFELAAPISAGSLDYARQVVQQATGSLPRAAFIRNNGKDVKFSEEGDGIGGMSIWMNINTMGIERMTDWRNSRQAVSFILHDGRWLGGMNAFNINDAAALVLLLLVIGGAAIAWRGCRAGKEPKEKHLA